jgi:lipopolysaccharide export system protein LptC
MADVSPDGRADPRPNQAERSRVGQWEARAAPGLAGAARYSRFAGVMKLVLPLVALGLLAIAIAWPRLYSEDDHFVPSFREVTAVDNDLHMINPRYSGTDTKDRPFTITAARAVQDTDTPTRVRLDQIEAGLDLIEGGELRLKAAAGVYDADAAQLDLAGGISLYSDLGYELHAREAHVDLGAGTLVGAGPIHGQGPAGQLDADRLEVFDRGARLLFTGEVRVQLVPTPENAG